MKRTDSLKRNFFSSGVGVICRQENWFPALDIQFFFYFTIGEISCYLMVILLSVAQLYQCTNFY